MERNLSITPVIMRWNEKTSQYRLLNAASYKTIQELQQSKGLGKIKKWIALFLLKLIFKVDFFECDKINQVFPNLDKEKDCFYIMQIKFIKHEEII